MSRVDFGAVGVANHDGSGEGKSSPVVRPICTGASGVSKVIIRPIRVIALLDFSAPGCRFPAAAFSHSSLLDP